MAPTGLHRTHYDVLGVDKDATQAEIKAVYRGLVRDVHPDSSTGAVHLFRLVQEAYETIGDPARRSTYDSELFLASRSSGTHRPPPSEPPPTRTPPTTPPPPRTGPTQGRPPPPYTHYDFFGTGNKATPPEAPTRPSGSNTAMKVGRLSVLVPARYRRLPAGARITWWEPLLIIAATVSAASLRYTGFTARLFHAQQGDGIFFMKKWAGVPHISVDSLQTLVKLVIVCAIVTICYAVRKGVIPTPLMEKLLLLGVLVSLSGAGEFLLASGRGKLALLVGVALYVAWIRGLRGLPKPADDSHWNSFPAWMRGVRAAQTRAKNQAKAQAKTRGRPRQF